MQKAAAWLEARWTQCRKDVWDDASIGPVAGILLSVLAALIVWLTSEYAPGAVDRGEQASSETRQAGDGVIDPFWGKVTIAVMTIATLAAGFEPIAGRRIDRWWRRHGKRGWFSLTRPARWLLSAPAALVLVPAKGASFIWSLADYILARPIAILAGAAWRGWEKRYAHFIIVMMLAIGAFLAADAGRLAPDAALAAIAGGLIAVLAIVRRWSWIESDRDTFLIERGEREAGRGTLRIGFKEDLRDEALFALACLFFLIPLGLDLVQQATSAAGNPAFGFHGDAPMPAEASARFVTWLGYFGAELAKTIPFVDWSEVFHVANGSPIVAQTAPGSQLAFVLRAGLDLLFLAALLQAVQIASRLRDQRAAFENNRLPILEPFTEKVELARVFEQVNEDLGLRPSAQPAILDFPGYDAARLKELIEGTAGTMDFNVRKAAAALLQKDYEAAPDSHPDTPRFWTERTAAETNAGYKAWLVHVASGLDPDEPARLQDAARRKRLLTLIKEDWTDPRARAQAVRVLGRSDLSAPEREALMGAVTADGHMIVQAAAAVALAKAGAAEAFLFAEGLIRRIPDDAVLPAQALAFALAHRGDPAAEIAARFPSTLHSHALKAARIQRAPMDVEAARTSGKLASFCESVAITPGHAGFPDRFLMGSDADLEAYADEEPQRQVAMTQAFALGRFTVTQAEYLAFTAATGRPSLQHASNGAWPAIEVSWHDAQAYCSWLLAITGDAWRLPSEAEWEYACRAGTDTAYSWGADWDAAKAKSNQSQTNNPGDAGSYEPNQWGLWDMHGNVFEWCRDPWHENYERLPPKNQAAWLLGGDFSRRVLRGGSWFNVPRDLRSAYRYRDDTSDRDKAIGFRVARTL